MCAGISVYVCMDLYGAHVCTYVCMYVSMTLCVCMYTIFYIITLDSSLNPTIVTVLLLCCPDCILLLLSLLNCYSGFLCLIFGTQFRELKGDTGIICSTDDFFVENGRYNFDPSMLGKNHEKNRMKGNSRLSLKEDTVET